MKSSICSSHITYADIVREEAGKVGGSQTLEAPEQKAEELRFYLLDGEDNLHLLFMQRVL